tara:strand:+ start:66 stop:434 length:369 start_codon:yes stop_codon:yes gene_type:complete
MIKLKGKGFAMGPTPYQSTNTPVYQRDLGPGVLGESLRNGVIILNEKLDPKFHDEVKSHEEVHVAQMKSGELDYDDHHIYWRGETIPKHSARALSGDPKKLGYEAQAYQLSGTKYKDTKYNV